MDEKRAVEEAKKHIKKYPDSQLVNTDLTRLTSDTIFSIIRKETKQNNDTDIKFNFNGLDNLKKGPQR